MLEFIIQLLFDKNCYSCGKQGSFLCPRCRLNKISYNWANTCPVCNNVVLKGYIHVECREYTYLDGLFYLTFYESFIKRLLQDIKYKGYFSILNEVSEIMSNFLPLYFKSKEFVVTSVPMFWQKYNTRGFNQSKFLAKKVSKNIKREYKNMLIKTLPTKPQMKLNKYDRLVNLNNAFSLKSKNLKQYSASKVLIIDDVFTTGSTLNQCARVLKEEGFKKVYGYVFARA